MPEVKPDRIVPESKAGETTIHVEKAAFAKTQGHEIRRWCSRTEASSVLLRHEIQVEGAPWDEGS